MDDMISRAAAIRIAERYGCNNGSAHGHHSGAADCIASEIAALQAVDAAPVVHGQWKLVAWHRGLKVMECSICTKRAYGATAYCPHCGAKLDAQEPACGLDYCEID